MARPLTRKNRPQHPWTEADAVTMRALYPNTRTADIAALLGVHIDLVYRKAQSMGLSKSAALEATDKSGRIFRGGKAGQATQFTPGKKPWNAGLKGYQPGGRSVDTQFKPGELSGAAAHNWVPVGAYRVAAKDNYLQRKTSAEGRGPKDWTGVHRLVWEAAHGPVPDGHVVVFLPGRKSTVLELITLDALECITRTELMRRNSIWAKGPELGALYQLKGAINRQVNRLVKTKTTQQATA